MDMQDASEKDRLLWAYIDGHCLPAEKELVEAHLLNDPVWKTDYEQLLAIHRQLPESILLSAPSLRFTKNVMEEIGRHRMAPAAATYINKKVIYGIAGFVLGLLLALTGYVMAATDWSSVQWAAPGWKIDKLSPAIPSFNWLSSPHLVTGFLIINALLALFLLDRLLAQRKRRTT